MRRPLNLKTKMMSMVVIAILIPLGCLIMFSKLYYHEIIEQKRQDEIGIQAQYAASMAVERLESAIKLSKDIIYEGNIQGYATQLKEKKINERIAYNYITEALKDKFYLNKEIVFTAIVLDCNPKQVYSVTADGKLRINDYLIHIHPNIDSLTKTLGNRVKFVVYDQQVYIIRNLISTKDFKKYGVIINEIDVPTFFKEFLQHSYMQEYVRIQLGRATLILKNQKEEHENLKGWMSFSQEIKASDWALNYDVRVSKDNMMAQEIGLIRGITVGVLIVLVILSMLLGWLYYSIIGPIEALTRACKKNEEGYLGTVVAMKRKDELGFLIESFNAMSRKNQYLFECVYKEELAVKEAKIKALQSQINPHFINNTLEIINWKAQMIGGKEISKMIRALSVIMNASSSRTNAKIVPLSEEISYMESYLYILERRFEERIQITKSIDESLLICEVPLLIIQPLLENAVVHGIEPAKGGKIHIRIQKEEEDVIISIGNDGKPLDVETMEMIQDILSGKCQPQKQHSVGIRNVNERIKLIYGEPYGLRIVKNDEGMTCSEVKLPYKCTNNSNKAHTHLVKNCV